MPSKTLHRQMWGVVDRDRFDIVVIDTPPLEQEAGIAASALWAATDVIVPMAPTTMEMDRVGPVWMSIADAADRPDRVEALRARVLLNRTVARAAATETARGLLETTGRDVFTPTIPTGPARPGTAKRSAGRSMGTT